jgi:hypothetical protein
MVMRLVCFLKIVQDKNSFYSIQIISAEICLPNINSKHFKLYIGVDTNTNLKEL